MYFELKNMDSITTISHTKLLVFLILFSGSFLHLETIKPSLCKEDATNLISCIEREKIALLSFKKGLTDPSGRLSTWVGEDCCAWTGVSCNNSSSGHVVKLDLRNPCQLSIDDRLNMNEGDLAACDRWSLGGKINPSLLNLKHLSYLDLSLNNFGGIRIPEFIGSLKNLMYLNVSCASFGETIPTHIGNLSKLRYLDLYVYSYSGWNPELKVDNLQWLSGLTSLEYLNMGFVNLSKAVNWLQEVSMLPSLLKLHLPYCQLDNLQISLSSINFTSLAILDLSNNNFNSSIPHWLFNLRSLTYLDLSYNNLQGPLPDSFANLNSLYHLDVSHNGNIDGGIPKTLGTLCKLKNLDLSWNNMTGEIVRFVENLSGCFESNLDTLNLQNNQFSGSLPESIEKLTSLKELVLSDNGLNGMIPKGIGRLENLVILHISQNSWEGVISEAHFANLSKLKELWILASPFNKSLFLNVSVDWVPPFRLKYIDMGNLQLGPEFPAWLRNQSDLYNLFLSNTGISGSIPDWFWNLTSQIDYFDLSKNQITGRLPSSLEFHHASGIDLSANELEGPLPLWSAENLATLLLGSNLFSGPIPSEIGKSFPNLKYLDLSRNSLNGGIPISMSTLKNLGALILSHNHFSGELPTYWEDLQGLWFIDFSSNSLSGKIPSSIGLLSSLISLKLNNNNLSGELPSSLQNCTNLFTLDVGDNKFSGKLPTGIGESLSSLLILRLRSNLFTGEIPTQLCHLSSLHFLDLSQNSLSGSIPPCFGNLTALTVRFSEFTPGIVPWYDEQIEVIVKGRELEFSSTRQLVKIINLSNNNLSGVIPEELTNLFGMGTLNLSVNHLGGRIPDNIGGLRWLETLDLSRNRLYGEIPPTMTSLTSLSHLNLSYNRLSGRIPSSTQLQTLNDSSIYEGNSELCGPPLTARCPGNETPSPVGGNGEEETEENWWEMTSFYISIVVGFVVGFLILCGSLVLNNSWRNAYFGFLEDMKDQFDSVIAKKPARSKSSSRR